MSIKCGQVVRILPAKGSKRTADYIEVATFVRARFSDRPDEEEEFVVGKSLDLSNTEAMTPHCAEKLNPHQKGSLLVGYRAENFQAKRPYRPVPIARLGNLSFILKVPQPAANENEALKSMSYLMDPNVFATMEMDDGPPVNLASDSNELRKVKDERDTDGYGNLETVADDIRDVYKVMKSKAKRLGLNMDRVIRGGADTTGVVELAQNDMAETASRMAAWQDINKALDERLQSRK